MGEYDHTCFYCRVADGFEQVQHVQLSSHPDFLAFYNPHAIHPVDVVVIPRKHLAFRDLRVHKLYELDSMFLLIQLFNAVRVVVAYVEKNHPEYGAPQGVCDFGSHEPHLNYHVIGARKRLY
jgi:hypothetical protein